MKRFSLAFVLCLAASAAVATPSVQNVTIAPCPGEGRVEVTYELSDAPAIVTVDFLTNGVSIGEVHFTRVWGDVNVMVTNNGAHTIQWRPDRDWNGNLADVAAQVTAWDPMMPPDYLVVGVVATNDVRYYVSTNALPDGGLANDIYRQRRIVMRKIPAKGVQWRMGAPARSFISASASSAFGNPSSRGRFSNASVTPAFWKSGRRMSSSFLNMSSSAFPRFRRRASAFARYFL